uniref:Craniofacial development protein 1 n=1 Tax=Trichobilharzia regenti TaxID=157069 RepID=A0AA85J3V7_TRIRE|nr:unnamed protein product [Trichobilharzia regenti]
MDNSEDDSTSDEEYVPPVKSSKLEGSSEDECSDDTEDESSDVSDDDSSVGKSNKKGRRKSRNSKCVSKISNPPDTPTAEELKAREDKIWEDFLKSDGSSKATDGEKVNVVKKYQFAGEEVEVTETVSKTANITKIPQNQNNTSTNTQPPKLKSPTLGPGLTSALQNLKSTVNKLPRLSTLEKSRLDWKQYVQKESLEDDLKAHNKGKDGYLEKQAFVSRTSEREYQYRQELKKPASNRRL